MTGNLIQVMKQRIANTGKPFLQQDFEEGGFGAKVNHVVGNFEGRKLGERVFLC